METIQKLKGMGFNSELFGLDDSEKDAADKTELDRFLEGFVLQAVKRVEKLSEPESELSSQAVLYFSICEILPIAWMRASIGVESLKVEGMSINLAKPSVEEKQTVLSSLLALAEKQCRLKGDSFPGVIRV